MGSAEIEGFGAATPGGKGGQQLIVTTLADSGPGSLRDAVAAKGARVITFAVSGDIHLLRPLAIREPYVTIDAGSAPAPGVTLRDDSVLITSHDVIIRHLRSRAGDRGQSRPSDVHAFSLAHADNVVLDHCSAYWGIDENIGMYQCRDITVQWCILAEALFHSKHEKGPHSMGMLVGGDETDRVSIHHCLFASNNQRNPRLQNGVVDMRNNLFYNYGTSGAYVTGNTRVNLIGNVYVPGPDTNKSKKVVLISPEVELYLKDTVLLDGSDSKRDWDLVQIGKEGAVQRKAAQPFEAPAVTTVPSGDVYEAVLSQAGATKPVRDAVDQRLVKGVREKTGRIIDTPEQTAALYRWRPAGRPLSDHPSVAARYAGPAGGTPAVQRAALLAQGQKAAQQFSLDFTVVETEGIARSNEPVRLRFPLDSRASGLGSVRLLNQSTQRDEPVEAAVTADSRTAEILFFSTQAANSRVDYRLYYGGTDGAAGPRELIRVSGEDLAWKVETRHMTINLEKNPGTGRSGQINTILLKEPPVLLTRARPTSTLHLSPNAAVGGGWNGVNRWDPPAKWSCRRGPLAVSIEREGQMPAVPGLHVKVVYEFFAATPAIAVTESIEARQEAQVSLLRMNEISFAQDPETPFTHICWEDAAGRVFVEARGKEKSLPADTRWMGFLNEREKFGVASLVERFAVSNPAGPPAPFLNPEAHFSGEPAHYFYRTLINQGKEGPLVSIPPASRYLTRYWLYSFRAAPATAGETVSRLYRAVQHPLRVQIKDTAVGRR